MSKEHAHTPPYPYPGVLDEPMQRAVVEVEGIIRQHYPTATFALSPAADTPGAVHLITTVDVEDTDAVVDTVIDRVMDLQINEGIPLHVIPVRTPARIAAARLAAAGSRTQRTIPILGRLLSASRREHPRV